MALKHAGPGEVVDLRPMGERLSGAKTAAIVKTRSFEAVRLVVPAGKEIPSHKISGSITLHCIEGHVQIGFGKAVIVLRAGDWVYLEGGEPHWFKGVENSSLLLTILFEGQQASARSDFPPIRPDAPA